MFGLGLTNHIHPSMLTNAQIKLATVIAKGRSLIRNFVQKLDFSMELNEIYDPFPSHSGGFCTTQLNLKPFLIGQHQQTSPSC